MRLDLDDGDDERSIDLLPMLDMVFLLLIFFLAATTFVRDEVELDLRLPPARSGTEAKGGHPLVVHVFADGRITADGREVTLEALRQKLAAALVRDAQQAVLVRGDAKAAFGTGIEVLDACRLAKVQKVDFAALPVKGD